MKSFFKKAVRTLQLVPVLTLLVAFAPPVAHAATSSSLGVAATYGVLANIFANASATTVNGDVGFTTPPAMAPAGTHTNYGSGAPYATAGADQGTALGALNAQTCDFSFGAAKDLSSLPQPIVPGVYCITGAVSVSTNITLSGSGTYIFRSVGALNTAASATVNLTGGAAACDVFWTPTGATTLGASTTFAGTIISNAGITMGASTVLTGRALAYTGTVTTDTNTITVPSCADITAPALVTNLSLSGATTSSMMLSWTAPGDDANVGTATLYDIRYATSPIATGADFTAAALVPGEPAPTLAGTNQAMTVTGLSANTIYYFALKSQDEVPNISAVSNVPSLSTATAPDTTAPATVTNLVLSGATANSIVLTWTAPGDDGSVGTAGSYDIRYSTGAIVTPADFSAASLVSDEPSPALAGTNQSMTVTGLSANTTYFFVMKSQDEGPNISAVSNVPLLSTLVSPPPPPTPPPVPPPSPTPTPPPAPTDSTATGKYDPSTARAHNPSIDIDLGLVATGGTPPCTAGTRIKLADDGNTLTQVDSAVYYCGVDGKRHAFPHSGVYFSWYPDFSGISILSAGAMANITLGPNVTYRPGVKMVKIQSDPKVYAIAGGETLRWVVSEQVAVALYGPSWNTFIDDVNVAFFENYTVGPQITLSDVTLGFIP